MNKRRRQKKRVKIFLNFTYLHKTQPGQKTAGNFPNFFEDIHSPDLWVSRYGCRLKYLMLSWSYGLSKTDEALDPKQQKFWARDNGNNNSDCYENDPRTPNIFASYCSCHLLSTTVSFIQDSMPLRFLCELKKFAKVTSHTSSLMAMLLGNFCIMLLFAFMAQVFIVRNKL